MNFFNAANAWHILCSPDAFPQAEVLAGYIGLLREQAGLEPKPAPILNAETSAVDDSAPVILLNAAINDGGGDGFSWRTGAVRMEIYGDSARGLWNGVFDFLAALGFRGEDPRLEPCANRAVFLKLPARSRIRDTDAAPGAWYPLRDTHACRFSAVSAQNRRRLYIDPKAGRALREQLVHWAAWNHCNALIIPLADTAFRRKAAPAYIRLALRYNLRIEAGGWELSALIPRRLFFLNREMFRMDDGKRTRAHNFCPTNPLTIKRLKTRVRRAFERAAPTVSGGISDTGAVFHLWPAEGSEKNWCSCPACRAFSPAEQNLIAVNTAAKVLAEICPGALLSYRDLSDNSPKQTGAGFPGMSAASGITPLGNMFVFSGEGLLPNDTDAGEPFSRNG